jgi:hypothetical protein
LSTHAQTFDCDSMSAWTSKIRPGGWYELWSFELGDSSVALGTLALLDSKDCVLLTHRRRHLPAFGTKG